MAEKKLENLSKVQLLEALCVDGKNAETLAKEYEMDKRTVQEYLYKQGLTKNTIKRESLVLLRGAVYDEANRDAKEDLVSHSASSITEALVIYLTGALSRAEKGEKPKQVLQRVICPLINSLLREEWLKLLLFIENQPIPDSILRFPPDGYLNQLLQEYASRLPAGYDIRKDSSRMPKNEPVTIKSKKNSDHKGNAKKDLSGETVVVLANAVKEVADVPTSDTSQVESPVAPDQLSKEEHESSLPAPEKSYVEQTAMADTVPMKQPVNPLENPITPSFDKRDSMTVKREKETSTVMHGKTKGFLSQDDIRDNKKRPIMGDALLKS